MRTTRNVLLALCASGALVAGAENPDWWKAEQELTALLWSSNAPIAKVVSDVSARPATSGPAAMYKVCVFLRAGMNQQAVTALGELKEICPRLEPYQAASIYHHACDEVQAWEVAQAVAELFAGTVTELSLENRLLKHWLDSGRTFEQVDAWLAARPPGVQGFWVKERLRFAQAHGRGEALLKRLSDAVRENPGDVTNAIVLLDALLYSRQGTSAPDLSWFNGVVKPARATHAHALAERLRQLENWRTALVYYQQAITIPLNDPEVQEMGNMRQQVMPATSLRADFAVTAREAMAECYLKLGASDKAQQVMVEAANLREKHRLPRNAMLAGMVQGASGQRTIEGRISEAEEKSKDDPEYWRERAQYYRGRGESAQEETALKKGLGLTKPQLPPERRGKGYLDWRAWMLSDYSHFLARQKREQEATALLREELRNAPALAESATRAAHLLAFDFSKGVSANDPVLWDWLANRPEWAYPEERLLWRMLENVPKEALDQHFSRAEKLAGNLHPSRAHTIGWIMNRMQFPERSIPLLKSAVARASDDELKQKSTFTLLESLLDTGNWKEAEIIFPEASRRLTARELPTWHSRLALGAARDGKKADALRLWVRTANVNPLALDGLAQLGSLGLRKELVTFYGQMQNELPQSIAPARALKLLHSN